MRIPQFIHSFFVCMLFGLLVPSASGQPANETPILVGYSTVSLDGLTASQTLKIDDEDYGDPTKLGTLVLKSGLHLVEVGADGVPIRVVLKAGKRIRLIDHIQPHRTAAASAASFEGVTQALMKPTKETGGLWLAGTGAAAIVVGCSFGLSAMSVASEASGLNRREIPRADYDAIVRSAQRRSTAANVSLFVGTTALATGLYLLYTDGYFSDEGAQ